MSQDRYEVDVAITALNKAVSDMLAFERSEDFGDHSHLDAGSPYRLAKSEARRAIKAIEVEGLTPQTAAKGTLALLGAVLLTTYESHPEFIHSARRMTEAAGR
ncbi:MULTISPECIES: hypothetical protein [unclassified Aureimonas]|uniref:hypothetical protein n=1 Tax=unclassified Aureimonas TaxID=2615206 RepID=UPI0006F59758|nr:MULTISPECIES: hypothetical protein [unclassified Aureimonas]KQT60574.1 hypothetical protein ASG62_08030 [Aureimonas sp. Leaf427]KQT79449.1 hypothetical protein ASG54_10625 [Aureimonas sp. Leaf460]